VDGQPVVGEAYADLERDAKRFRAVENAMGPPLDSPFNMHRWHFETDGMDTRYATLGEYADALLGGETGEVQVGPSVAALLAALYREMNRHRREIMPEHIAATVLRSYGLATTYAEAAELWARMEGAAKSDGNN